MTKKTYQSPRIVRYPTPVGRIEEYAVATGTNVVKCTTPGTCTPSVRGASLPEWMTQ